MAVEQAVTEAPQPNAFVLYFLPLSEEQGTACCVDALETRQSFPAEWIVTPEVYSGLTHLPHGPPALT
jgi:hypothetical protein